MWGGVGRCEAVWGCGGVVWGGGGRWGCYLSLAVAVAHFPAAQRPQHVLPVLSVLHATCQVADDRVLASDRLLVGV